MQNSVSVWGLQSVVYAIKSAKHREERRIDGDPIHSVFIKLDRGVCKVVCWSLNGSILEGRVQNRWEVENVKALSWRDKLVTKYDRAT